MDTAWPGWQVLLVSVPIVQAADRVISEGLRTLPQHCQLPTPQKLVWDGALGALGLLVPAQATAIHPGLVLWPWDSR